MRKQMTPTAVYWIEPAVFTAERSKDKHRIVIADGKRLEYSAHDRIPALGETIIGPGNFGKCKVLGYFTEDGFYGVLCKPAKPPVWFKQQEKERAREKAAGPIGLGNIGLFGAEFDFTK